MRLSGNAEGRRCRQSAGGGGLDVELQRKRSHDKRIKVADDSSQSFGGTGALVRSFALRLLVVLLFAAASMTILLVPSSSSRRPQEPSFSSGPGPGPVAQRSIPHNTSDGQLLRWLQGTGELTALRSSLGTGGALEVGLVNFDDKSSGRVWEILSGGKTPRFISFEAVSDNTSWSDLYPEWIDEEERWNTPTCPRFPEATMHKGLKLHMVAAKVPCDRANDPRNWTRSVERLHALLVTARVAVDTGRGRQHMYILLDDECRPAPNVFPCSELVDRRGSFWLFKSDLKRLERTLSLPPGSCQLSVPLTGTRRASRKAGREAYATILHSAQLYVCGAISLARSIRMTGSKRDLVILVDQNISPHHREGLQAAGWRVIEIQRIRNPKAEPESYNEWNYSKFRLWQLTEYRKLIYVDADIILLRNMDLLFQMPEISATGNHESMFNSGVMVIEPSNCTFEMLMQQIDELESYNGGDQGYLNEVFTRWYRLPKHMNFLKHFSVNDSEELAHRLELLNSEPPVLYAMHFLGLKPWLCFRDYDCNWNQRKLHEYANDAAHARWWRVHDSMSKKLQSYCLLRSKQKASLEWDRRQAERERFPDGHWKVKIKDSRLRTCFEEFCYWESMLWHWGEDQAAAVPPPPLPPPRRRPGNNSRAIA